LVPLSRESVRVLKFPPGKTLIALTEAAVAVAVGVKIDIQVVLTLLAEVVVVLEETVAEIKVLLTGTVGSTVLQLDAIILGLPEVAFLLASLLFVCLTLRLSISYTNLYL